MNQDPETLASAPSTCARCLARVRHDADACPRCATPFTGAGRFDRIQGPAPSPLFLASVHLGL